MNLLDSMAEAKRVMENFKLPALVIQGAKDRIVEAEGAFHFMERSKSEDKTLLLYPNLWHDISSEPELWSILEKAKGWLEARIEPDLDLN